MFKIFILQSSYNSDTIVFHDWYAHSDKANSETEASVSKMLVSCLLKNISTNQQIKNCPFSYLKYN